MCSLMKKTITSHSRVILYLNVLHSECVAVLISNGIRIARYTLITEAVFGSPLYEFQLVESAIEIFGVVSLNFRVFIHYIEPYGVWFPRH